MSSFLLWIYDYKCTASVRGFFFSHNLPNTSSWGSRSFNCNKYLHFFFHCQTFMGCNHRSRILTCWEKISCEKPNYPLPRHYTVKVTPFVWTMWPYLAMASSLSLMALWSCSLGSRISAIVFIRSCSSRREHISTESSAICRSHGRMTQACELMHLRVMIYRGHSPLVCLTNEVRRFWPVLKKCLRAVWVSQENYAILGFKISQDIYFWNLLQYWVQLKINLCFLPLCS